MKSYVNYFDILEDMICKLIDNFISRKGKYKDIEKRILELIRNDQLTEEGIVFTQKITGSCFRLFGILKTLTPYYFDKDNSEKYCYLKIRKSQEETVLEYFQDKNCINQLRSKSGKYCADVLFISAKKIIIADYLNYKREKIEKNIEYYFLNPAKIPADGIFLNYQINRGEFFLFGSKVDLAHFMANNNKEYFYIKINKNNEDVFLSFYYDKYGQEEIKNQENYYPDLKLIKDKDSGKIIFQKYNYIDASIEYFIRNINKNIDKELKIFRALKVKEPTILKNKIKLRNYEFSEIYLKINYENGRFYIEYYKDKDFIMPLANKKGQRYINEIKIKTGHYELSGMNISYNILNYFIQYYYLNWHEIAPEGKYLGKTKLQKLQILGENINLKPYLKNINYKEYVYIYIFKGFEKCYLAYYYDRNAEYPLISKEGLNKKDLLIESNGSIKVFNLNHYYISINYLVENLFNNRNSENFTFKEIIELDLAKPTIFGFRIDLEYYYKNNLYKPIYATVKISKKYFIKINYYYDKECKNPLCKNDEKKGIKILKTSTIVITPIIRKLIERIDAKKYLDYPQLIKEGLIYCDEDNVELIKKYNVFDLFINYFYKNPEKLNKKGLVIPIYYNSFKPTLLNCKRDFSLCFAEKKPEKIGFYLKISHENKELIIDYFHDASAKEPLVSEIDKLNYRDIVIKKDDTLILKKFNTIADYILHYYFFPEKLPQEGLIIPYKIKGKTFGFLNKTRNLSVYCSDSRNEYYAKLFYADKLFQVRYFWDIKGEKPLLSKINKIKACDIVYVHGYGLDVISYGEYRIRRLNDFILKHRAKLNELVVYPHKVYGKNPRIIGIQRDLRNIFPLETNPHFYIAKKLNEYGEEEIHYFYDMECQYPLKEKSTNRRKIDIIFRSKVFNIYFKRKNMEDMELKELIESQKADKDNFYGVSLNQGIGKDKQLGDYISSELYSPEYLIFDKSEENISIRLSLLNNFKRALFYYINGETMDEAIYKYVNYSLEKRPEAEYGKFVHIPYYKETAIDRFYDEVVILFEMKYLDYYLDQEIADKFHVDIDDIKEYIQQCEEILKSEYFYQELSKTVLLDPNLANLLTNI